MPSGILPAYGGTYALWFDGESEKARSRFLTVLDTRWNVFLCSIYWSNIQKNYTKMNHSNLALLKSHINRNIPTSFQSFGVTETAERAEPVALKSPARHPEEGSVASCLGSLHRHTATISTSSWRKRHFFFLCWFCFFFFLFLSADSPEWRGRLGRTLEGGFPSCQKMSFFFIIKPENKSKTIIILKIISAFECHSRPAKNRTKPLRAIC